MSTITSSHRPVSPMLIVCLITTYIVWGSTYLAIHVALESLPPFLLSASRNFMAGLLLMGIMRMRGAPWPTSTQWRNSIFIGFLMVSLSNGLVCYAEQRVSSGVAAVVFACGPLLTVVFGCLAGKRPRLYDWIAVVMGVVGVWSLYSDATVPMGRWSFAVLLIATGAWCIGTALQQRLDMPIGGASAPAQMLGASLCLLPMAALDGERWPSHITTSSFVAMLYLAVFGSILAYTAYLYVVARAGSVLALSSTYVNPIVAGVIGIVIAHDPATPQLLVATLAISLSLALMAYGKKQRSRSPQLLLTSDSYLPGFYAPSDLHFPPAYDSAQGRESQERCSL